MSASTRLIRRRPVLAGAVSAAALAAGCGPLNRPSGGASAGDSGAAGGGTLVVALSSEPRNLSPIFLDINAGNWKAFNGLVDLDAALNPVPDLAAELPTVTDGGQRVRVRLREGVRFHDGRPLTAEDVAFTWRSIMDEQVASPVRTVMAVDLQEVRALDPRTVEFGLSRPDPAFVEKLYTGIVPRHLLQGEDLNKTAFNRKPVGTGPYKFEEWRDGERRRGGGDRAGVSDLAGAGPGPDAPPAAQHRGQRSGAPGGRLPPGPPGAGDGGRPPAAPGPDPPTGALSGDRPMADSRRRCHGR
jgi:peptide/nickel transport system substrate-binding protein